MTRTPRRPAALVLATLLCLTTLSCGQDGNRTSVTLSPTPDGSGAPEPRAPSTAPAVEAGDDEVGPRPGRSPAVPAGPQVVETVARGLETPWGLAFFPNGDALVTERDTTRVLRVTGDRRVVQEVGLFDTAVPEGEGGLLGLAIAPGYPRDRDIYLYVTTATDNRVVRARLEGGVIGTPEVLLDGIPKGVVHDGGRIVFGPDDHLYVATGETGDPALARDPDSLAGKILRLTLDGEAAPGNPGGGLVWSSGHRNVQGLAFDDQDRLWASEFGDETADELNLVEAGGDYGWPVVEGTGDRADREAGLLDPERTWAPEVASPAGLAFADGSLWMAALRGERLWQVPVDDDGGAGRPTGFLEGRYGRLRTVATAPDGSLWVTTSNRDGRGDPGREDDRILRIEP